MREVRLDVLGYRNHMALAISEASAHPWDDPELIIHSGYRASLTVDLIKKHCYHIDLYWDGTLRMIAKMPDRVWGIINAISKMKRMSSDLYSNLLDRVGDLDAFEELLTPYAILDKLSGKGG